MSVSSAVLPTVADHPAAHRAVIPAVVVAVDTVAILGVVVTLAVAAVDLDKKVITRFH